MAKYYEIRQDTPFGTINPEGGACTNRQEAIKAAIKKHAELKSHPDEYSYTSVVKHDEKGQKIIWQRWK